MPREPNPELDRAFPELRDWNEGKGITLDNWLSIIGNVSHAVTYSTMFWPTFVEYEGCIVWHDVSPSNFEDWMTTLSGDKTNVEKVINHRHITDYFANDESGKDSIEQVEYLGQLLQTIWTLKLQHDFPLFNVQVEFFWQDREATDDAQITVYCDRS